MHLKAQLQERRNVGDELERVSVSLLKSLVPGINSTDVLSAIALIPLEKVFANIVKLLFTTGKVQKSRTKTEATAVAKSVSKVRTVLASNAKVDTKRK